ncbi:hypothetical protein KP509_13G011600 [Ceratopteris richardii]|uniref:Aluminum-activated malate transporter n=1 Tax=Ceratopteris richardii TaxID=49495 RepID=A0A8T2TIR2_CERRI|nr:hypothetical protein KP509_13G011600 [Ceratopteris richardii]KAH7420540.1 hypothetical protein KP509_13G011600 [Ceratopteris richardii]
MGESADLREPILERAPRSGRGCLARTSGLLRGISRSFSSVKNTFTSLFVTIRTLIVKEPAKTIHSFKMGLALSLAFLLVMLKQPYSVIGSHAIWAVMTVVVVFEFGVGATLSKGLNRGAGTLGAGILAVILGQFARICGHVAYPIVVGLCVFVVGGVVTFTRLLPSWKTYEFGFRTFLITFSLIMVAEYRQGDPVDTAINRFIIILIGAGIGLSVNIFVLPLWAGDELHDSIVKNFESVADSLEVCVDEYLKGTVLERVPSKIFMGLAADDPVYKGYRTALVSASKEESLASFAVWEPPHGRFMKYWWKYPWQQYYPWPQYQKVGAVLRHCTYSVVALHGCLRSAIQAPLPVRLLFETELRDVSLQSANVLRELGKQVKNMQKGDPMEILNGVKHSVERLQQSLYLNSYLLVKQEGFEDGMPENLSLKVLPELKKYEKRDNQNGFFRSGSVHKMGIAYSHDEASEESRKYFRKLNSWPYRPIDDFDFAKDSLLEQRVRVLESASALSLGTFATLLMEVALRLDYVVEAVDELSDMAKFKCSNEKSVHGKNLNGTEDMVLTAQENC